MKLIKQSKPELLSSYFNGNYSVKLFSDGTKIRETENDEFISEFPENIDIKIKNKCNAGCNFCFEDSTIDGKQGQLELPFFDTLQPGTEISLGGGNIFEHPDLEKFLEVRKKQGIISNITVNQVHFAENIDKINRWQMEKLVYGVGISYNGSVEKLVKLYKSTAIPQNVVVHTIAGIHNLEPLIGHNLKVLILGYKSLRRGQTYKLKYDSLISKNINKLQESLPRYLKSFNVLSFDNLALEQLNVKSLIEPAFWEEHYMGDDGTSTMYIDLVKREFASSSTSNLRYNLDEYNDIKSIFKIVLNEKAN